jgi:hypothetical protein
MFSKTTHRAKSRPGNAPSGELASTDLSPPSRRFWLAATLGGVRLTEFWNRMNAQFGDVYAQSVAKDFVFDQLGGRTVERALADGVDAKAVWRAVCETFKVPERLR